MPRILHWLLTENENVQKDQIFWVHTYDLLQTKGRRVQSMVEIGSEMLICIRYKQINKQTKQKRKNPFYLYIYDIVTASNFILRLLLIFNMTTADRTNCFQYTGKCPADWHLYGHEELRQYTYCHKCCSKGHGLQKL